MEKLFLSIGAMKAGTTWLYPCWNGIHRFISLLKKKSIFWPTITSIKNILLKTIGSIELRHD